MEYVTPVQDVQPINCKVRASYDEKFKKRVTVGFEPLMAMITFCKTQKGGCASSAVVSRPASQDEIAARQHNCKPCGTMQNSRPSCVCLYGAFMLVHTLLIQRHSTGLYKSTNEHTSELQSLVLRPHRWYR